MCKFYFHNQNRFRDGMSHAISFTISVFFAKIGPQTSVIYEQFAQSIA